MADEGIPNRFQQSSPILASFPSQELATGLGYEVYYGVCQSFPASALAPYTTANPQYFLMDNNALDLYTDTTSTSTQTTATLNFDSSPFKIPRVVSGKVFINFAVKGHTTTTNCTFSARLYKYDGSTETAITALQTLDYNGNNAPAVAMAANQIVNFMAAIDATDTIIKVTEKLRLKVVVTDVDNEAITVYHDPLGRDVFSNSNFSSRMKIKVPFRNFQQ